MPKTTRMTVSRVSSNVLPRIGPGMPWFFVPDVMGGAPVQLFVPLSD
ncbi:MAG TPA: hypothetical protein PK024_10650 [Methanospirillum sp.]|nr:hypothetical protein [Methanospirillum sp.]HOJ97280.1 hypothetical protein [Methanospirillum sp.]HPP78563.1 hypothetical protein [Methanospirillum sp.]